MLFKLDQLANRLVELDELLGLEAATSNMDNFRKMSREHAELGPLVSVYHQYQTAQGDIVAAQDMLADPEMKEFAQDEIEAARERLLQLDLELQKMLLPKDENDERNIFLEIRAGTGGDESALFAGDLLRMYTRYAERNRWQVEMVSESSSDLGGYREVIVRIVGQGAYSKLKFESGGHRVQRVPATETQGRIHTSACTVAVRRRRPAHQQDRFRRALDAPADRHRGRMPGRPQPAQEQGAGAEGAGCAHQGRAVARAAKQGSGDA